ncbi:MAG: RNA polymerase sigma-54 factor, partial [Bdellovibrionales bacterium]|nr:RNA polymerase sigma-54 factor [Bdellovibrionales bacterium]
MHLKMSMKLSQQLRMTPQLQQAIKLLQLSRLELETQVRKELTENPILEEVQDTTEDEPRQKAEKAENSEFGLESVTPDSQESAQD